MERRSTDRSGYEPAPQTVRFVCGRLASWGAPVDERWVRDLVREILRHESPRLTAELRAEAADELRDAEAALRRVLDILGGPPAEAAEERRPAPRAPAAAPVPPVPSAAPAAGEDAPADLAALVRERLGDDAEEREPEERRLGGLFGMRRGIARRRQDDPGGDELLSSDPGVDDLNERRSVFKGRRRH